MTKLAENIAHIITDEMLLRERGGEDTSFSELFRNAGYKVEVGYNYFGSQHGEKVWEHPEIIKHNEGAHILDTWFCTLYELDNQVIFEYGRIGNTRMITVGEE